MCKTEPVVLIRVHKEKSTSPTNMHTFQIVTFISIPLQVALICWRGVQPRRCFDNCSESESCQFNFEAWSWTAEIPNRWRAGGIIQENFLALSGQEQKAIVLLRFLRFGISTLYFHSTHTCVFLWHFDIKHNLSKILHIFNNNNKHLLSTAIEKTKVPANLTQSSWLRNVTLGKVRLH